VREMQTKRFELRTMTVHHITFKRDSIRQQHITDAQNAEDWPAGEIHEVVVHPDEITIEGTPNGIRWLYDFLHHLKRAWRAEGEQWCADIAEDMARKIWDLTDGDLPDRQRTKQMI